MRVTLNTDLTPGHRYPYIQSVSDMVTVSKKLVDLSRVIKILRYQHFCIIIKMQQLGHKSTNHYHSTTITSIHKTTTSQLSKNTLLYKIQTVINKYLFYEIEF